MLGIYYTSNAEIYHNIIGRNSDIKCKLKNNYITYLSPSVNKNGFGSSTICRKSTFTGFEHIGQFSPDSNNLNKNTSMKCSII